MPVALSLLLQLFEDHGQLGKLEAFVSRFGAEFYGLAQNQDTVTFSKEPWTVLKMYHNVVPLCSGQTLNWSLTGG